jgi:hypothetical protein
LHLTNISPKLMYWNLESHPIYVFNCNQSALLFSEAVHLTNVHLQKNAT